MSKDKIEVSMNVYDIPILIEELEKAEDEIKKLQQENQQLKKQKDDVVEYIKEHIKYECDDTFNGMQFYSYHLYNFNKEDLLRMLGEIDDN